MNTSVVFWRPEVRVGEEAAFQISLAASADAMISELPIHSISIVFSEGYAPIIIHHDASIHPEPVRLVPLGQVQGEQPVEVRQHLRWRPGNQVILTGTLASDVPGIFSVRVFLSIFSQDKQIDGVDLEYCGDAERRELDDRGTARTMCVSRIEFCCSSLVEFSATRVVYPRNEGRHLERDVSALDHLASDAYP